MIGNEIMAASQRQSDLDAAKAEFFAAGGKLALIESPVVSPRPARNEVQTQKQSKSKKRKSCDRAIDVMARRREHVDKIRKLSTTMCYREAILATGMSHSALYRASVEGDFKFQPDPNYGYFGGANEPDPERDEKLCERLSAFRDIGLTRRQACRRMGISACVLRRLINQCNFIYPVNNSAGELK